MAEEKEVLLEVKDLNVTYGSGRKAFAAVQNANFQIYKGETFGLVGESGSGKTTIGRAILRIPPPSGKKKCGRLCWTWACCRSLLPAFPTNFPAASGSALALPVR